MYKAMGPNMLVFQESREDGCSRDFNFYRYPRLNFDHAGLLRRDWVAVQQCNKQLYLVLYVHTQHSLCRFCWRLWPSEQRVL